MATTPRVYQYLAAGSLDKKEVKKGDGYITNAIISNASAALKVVKLYDSEASPNLASALPVATLQVAANETKTFTFGNTGLPFTKGLWHAFTIKAADGNEESVTAADLRVTLLTM